MSFKSNTALLMKEIFKNSGHHLVKKNIKAISLNKEMDSLYQIIEEDYEEYKNIIAFLPYSEFNGREYIFYGLMLISGKIGIYKYIKPVKNIKDNPFHYGFTEYKIKDIELTYKELSEGYLKECFYYVSVYNNGDKIASFSSGKKLYSLFDEIIKEEQKKQ